MGIQKNSFQTTTVHQNIIAAGFIYRL